MFVVDRVLGNTRNDERLALAVQAKEKSGEAERVLVSFHDAQRRRLRLTTEGGTEVGIDLAAGRALQDGDVLYRSPDESRVVVVEVAPSEAVAIRLSREMPPEELFAFAVRLGHMLGNQHWPIQIEHDVVLTPVSIDRKVMDTVLKAHGLDGLEWEFIAVEPGRVPTGMPHVQHEHG